MTTARSTIAPPGSAGYYHCVSRCVRRAWLCGSDRLTGKSYDHRRDWLVARMNELASIFAVRVLAFAAMSNHLHLALEFNPAWVEGWTDVECLNRWRELTRDTHTLRSRLIRLEPTPFAGRRHPDDAARCPS